MTNVDPITLAVVRGAFEQVADEMDTVIVSSAMSPIIADSWDRASGVYHPETGEVIAQGSTSLPVFVFVMQDTVQEVLKDHHPSTMQDGDVFVLNDPYRGGTHTMDVKFVRPYFRDGVLTAFVADTGHWPDVGGMSPGGFSPTATDVYQEGLRLPPVKIYEAGRINQALVDVMMLNMRVPEERYGDMAAQINALELGCRRLDELFDRLDRDTVFACVDELKRRSEKQMRDHIADIPDGVYRFSDELDNDGVDHGRVLIDLKLTVEGSEITFDLSGSASQCRGPFNSPLASTITGLMIGIKHVFWDVPVNSGCFQPFHFVIPRGSLFDPEPPAPVNGTTTETCQRLAGVVLGALAQAIPGRIPAGAFGTASNICIGGNSPTKGHYAAIFNYGGGYGGHAEGDGLTNGPNLISVARNNSIEVLEHTLPLLFTKHGVRENSAGDGQFRGGFGIEASFRLRDGDAYLTLLGDRGTAGAHGIEGGEAGQPADHDFHVDGKSFKAPHPTKIDRLYLRPGDGVDLRTPGGGGYGKASQRSSAARRDDAENGFLDNR